MGVKDSLEIACLLILIFWGRSFVTHIMYNVGGLAATEKYILPTDCLAS